MHDAPDHATCPCAYAPLARHGDTLHVTAPTPHTMQVLRRAADSIGLDAAVKAGVLRLTGDGLVAFAATAHDQLTELEATQCRILLSGAERDDDLLAAALSAPTLAQVAAEAAHASVLALLADEHAFRSHYQPIVRLDVTETAPPVGYEALLRTADPAFSPGDLFRAAAKTDQLFLLDRIARQTAIKGAKDWLPDDALLFVNFVPTSIYRPEVCLQTTWNAARAAGIDFGHIVFEVTETERTDRPEHLTAILDVYRAEGSRVALDDVGAGWSSLNLLAAVEPDVVKIDRALVQALPAQAAVAVVSAIVHMTHGLGGKVIAEGIETPDQAAAARDLGCDWGQGYHFARPARPADLCAGSTV